MGKGRGEYFRPYNDGEALHLTNGKIELLGNRVDLSIASARKVTFYERPTPQATYAEACRRAERAKLPIEYIILGDLDTGNRADSAFTEKAS